MAGMTTEVAHSLKVVVEAISAPPNEGWVKLRFEQAGREPCIEVFAIEDIARHPEQFLRLARKAGEPLLTAGSRSSFMHRVEAELRLAQQSQQTPRFRVAETAGWTEGAFATPTKTFPIRGPEVVFRPRIAIPSLTYQRSGSLRGWWDQFGWALRHNPLLLFGACVALAPPLLTFAGLEGCVFSVVGENSKGKSTLLKLMGSTRGGCADGKLAFQASWRSTAAALEKVAAAANDGLLVLDDIRLLPGDARGRASTLKEALYFLTSGIEKDRYGRSEQLASFRIIVATSDNHSLRQNLAEGGVMHDGSMDVRFIELPATRKFGVLDQVPEEVRPSDFADWINKTTLEYYGAPIHVVLHALASMDRGQIEVFVREAMNEMREILQVPQDASSQARVANYFGLVYAAGLMARRTGILRLSRRRLIGAVVDVYRSHLSVRAEYAPPDMIKALALAISKADLVDLRAEASPSFGSVAQAIGFKTDRREALEFSFTPAQFAAIIPPPYSVKRMCDALKKRGLLLHDGGRSSGSAKNQTKRRICGQRKRVYVISGRLLEELAEERGTT